MIRKICNHCGRIYIDTCECQKKKRKSSYKHNSFYDGIAWKTLSKQIKQRDLYTDRLALFLKKKPIERFLYKGHIKTLIDYLITPTGQIRRFTDLIEVHHIEPIEENKELRYNEENLISLYKSVHEYIHKIYNTNEKETLQNLLREAVRYKV